MTIWQISDFLYEIDSILTDEQISQLAEEIFNNQEKLLQLVDSEKFEKMSLKIQTESYDKGYQEGANQKNNKPCVCGFWGDK